METELKTFGELMEFLERLGVTKETRIIAVTPGNIDIPFREEYIYYNREDDRLEVFVD